MLRISTSLVIFLIISVGLLHAADECENDENGSLYTNEDGNTDRSSCKSRDNKSTIASGKLERTFCLIKPDGVQRNLIGDIIKRYENKGLKLVALKFLWPKESELRAHYAKAADTPFFEDLIKYMKKGPVVAMVWEGYNVIKIGRQLLTGGNRLYPLPGSIRGDFSSNDFAHRFTVAHGSDTVEEAEREIFLFFKEEELVSWSMTNDIWIYQK